MFQQGDLLWLPQKTVLLKTLSAPQAIKIIEKPEIGLFMKDSEEDSSFCVVVYDGREWVANKKHIRLLRRDYVSEVN